MHQQQKSGAQQHGTQQLERSKVAEQMAVSVNCMRAVPLLAASSLAAAFSGGGEFVRPRRRALPPAADRDLAAEAAAAAAQLARPRLTTEFTSWAKPLPRKPAKLLPLVSMQVDDGNKTTTFVAERISESDRKGALTSWLRPIALRTSSSSRADTPWSSTEGDADAVTIFSKLAPSVMLPSARLAPVADELVPSIRALHAVHEASAARALLELEQLEEHEADGTASSRAGEAGRASDPEWQELVEFLRRAG